MNALEDFADFAEETAGTYKPGQVFDWGGASRQRAGIVLPAEVRQEPALRVERWLCAYCERDVAAHRERCPNCGAPRRAA